MRSCSREQWGRHVFAITHPLIQLTGTPRSLHPHGNSDGEQEYKIRAIIDQDRKRYRIEWEDDEITGEQFPTTWEPKENANRLAVDDWEETKRKRSTS